MITGYCDRCKTNVMLNRGDFDVCLAIILLLFTAGIGFIIYLAVFYSKPADRCVHCGYKITKTASSHSFQPSFQSQNYQQPVLSQPPQEKGPLENKTRYCSFCGEQLNYEANFCSNCGSRN